jgi:hypothetical protein
MPTAYKNRPFPLPHFPQRERHREVGKGKTCEILVGHSLLRLCEEASASSRPQLVLLWAAFHFFCPSWKEEGQK